MAPPGHGDDQLLASALELKWEDLTSSVLLVTRDRNLKNKARMSRVAYVDVEAVAKPRVRREKRDPQREKALKESARQRLGGELLWARSKLGVPPTSAATNPNRQSWTIEATPLAFDAHDFRERVLGTEAPEWFAARALELFPEPGSPPSAGPAEETAQMGFAVLRSLDLPVKGSVLLVADAGGVVGVQYYVEPIADDRRVLLLTDIENENLRPLVQTCADALTLLGATGRALLEAWIGGVSNTEVLTAGHPTLNAAEDGWLSAGFLHLGGELESPADDAAVDELVVDWTYQLARTAGIRARD
ncbi:MAG: PIN domain-containing protein [Actinomycetota bacterium]|nr:PIN domain-containing protein [Actinomycetota bacterium]